MIITITLKRLANRSPCPTPIVVNHATDILENENFRLAFHDDSSELPKQSASGVIKTATFPSH